MLGKVDATPMIAVRDLDLARQFYEETLGLSLEQDWGEGVSMRSGGTVVNLYKSEYAGTNKATALNFDVVDLESEVDQLKSKGVAFEHYDLPGLTRKGDIHTAQGMKTAWFKDPDGNILSLLESTTS